MTERDRRTLRLWKWAFGLGLVTRLLLWRLLGFWPL